MIPQFPQFIKLSFMHKLHIEKHILKHPPYSDFNFTSLISWGDDDTYLSELNGNLVIKFKDYLTHEPFFTFIGTNKVTQTIKTLLKQSDTEGLQLRLRLIPEIVLKTDSDIIKYFDIFEDRDNFDYIYLIEDALYFQGSKHRAKRNFINRFKKLYKSSHQLIDLKNPQIQQTMVDLFSLWQRQKEKNNEEVKDELTAIKKIFEYAKYLNLSCIGLYVNNELIGFSINEILPDTYAMNLFEKANTAYQGIFPYLKHITAVYLHQQGCKFLSHEQDLGIEGLRKSKMSYHPHFFLKKYIISRK